ncbi:Ribosomal protein S23 domain containing protein [Aphelenchoides besseyi]|nr:Ribosomal protein S23 domain containing protein [Aphelenchoides besseyi]KAI6199147.1 Ribosomal protein S23 domain containing protein [Aphelenchoides besseyi]
MATQFSRVERAAHIFSRVTGLIRGGQLKWEDRPLWYDVYVLAPPLDEPIWNIKMPKRDVPLQKLLFDEDDHRYFNKELPTNRKSQDEEETTSPPPIENLIIR